ncbi:MAG: ribosome biogenesis GTPase Der [Treponema sp.]|jgi:GTP-binding protein|nr:ribosome biogenesis GTPase Der [Treponema sp.]
MADKSKLPVVALAGRPNVGKSTLFNRLLHKRRAITDPTPGVTRDPVFTDTVILGKPLKLVDTGGFKLERDRESPEGELDKVVVERTVEVLKKADLIVLLFEAGELSLEDEEFIALLRPYQGKLLAAVNKTEGGRREAEAWNFLSFGFEKVYMISAEHGDNVRELEEAIVSRISSIPDPKSPLADETDDDEAPIRIALLGKPNTGKSTLSNRLTSSSASIVSDIPGTTRDVVEGAFIWKKRNFQVLDTAGIRRKTRVSENIEYYSVNRAIKTIDEADIVFLIIDAQEGLTDQDKKIAALAHDRGRGLILVLNKWDTMPDVKNTFEAVRDRIHFLFGQMDYAPIIALSALDGNGIENLLDTSLRMYSQLTRRIETAALNKALEKWLAESPPPSGPQTRFKIRYAIQKEANPVEFIFFASRHNAVSGTYLAYLRNRIRRDLGFSLIPLSIELRPSATGDRPGFDKKRHHPRKKRR